MAINNPSLYARVKSKVFLKYKKNSAYRSGQIVKEYKKAGGTYSGSKTTGGVQRWFKEKWKDINPYKTKTSYPVYRPTVRINSATPLTLNELSKGNVRRQSILKQRLKGRFNLPPFIRKNE